LRDAHARREFRSLLDAFDAAVYEHQIIDAAKAFLGYESFGVGVAFGLVSYPVKEALHLLELTKTFVFADLYDLIYLSSTWTAVARANLAGPSGVITVLALRALRDVAGFAEPLRAAHQQREAILAELRQIFTHPIEFAESLPGKLKTEYADKWRQVVELRARGNLPDQFRAGQIVGELLMEVLLTIIAVIDVAGVAVKLASKVPQLVRLARTVRLGEGAGASRSLSAGARAAEPAQAARDARAVRVADEAAERPASPAKQHELPLKGITAEQRALAASTEVSTAAMRARTDVIDAYLSQYGREWNGSGYGPMTKQQIQSHLNGYDMSKPVKVGPPPPCPAKQYQWQRPNGNQGMYYADKGATPDELGISAQAGDASGNTYNKVQKAYEVDPNAPYIESTSAPAQDTWSQPGKTVPTSGGGTQRTIGDRSFAKPI
jgi:Bacterial toxin 46